MNNNTPTTSKKRTQEHDLTTSSSTSTRSLQDADRKHTQKKNSSFPSSYETIVERVPKRGFLVKLQVLQNCLQLRRLGLSDLTEQRSTQVAHLASKTT